MSDLGNNKNWKDEYNDELILRITTENSEDIITAYNIDKPIFKNNLIDIYLYGKLYAKEPNKKTGYYTITRKYQTDFQQLNITNKIKVIKDYFKVILIANSNNIFYRDQKILNIGYEIIKDKINGDDCKFIIIDYDANTLVKMDKFFNEYSYKDHSFYGTYAPNYIIYNLYNKKNITINMLDKYYVSGMLNILYNITNFEKPLLQQFIIDAYNFFLVPFDITEKTEKIIDQLNKLYIDNTVDLKKLTNKKESVIVELFNFFIKKIILACLSTTYVSALSIDDIKKYIAQIDTVFLNLLCNVNLSIKDLPENTDFTSIFKIPVTSGGYTDKYLKYKHKYIELKKNINL